MEPFLAEWANRFRDRALHLTLAGYDRPPKPVVLRAGVASGDRSRERGEGGDGGATHREK
jgi:hypothetical protein